MKSLLGHAGVIAFIGLMILGYGDVCWAEWTFITEDRMESKWYVDLAAVQREKRGELRFVTC